MDYSKCSKCGSSKDVVFFREGLDVYPACIECIKKYATEEYGMYQETDENGVIWYCSDDFKEDYEEVIREQNLFDFFCAYNVYVEEPTEQQCNIDEIFYCEDCGEGLYKPTKDYIFIVDESKGKKVSLCPECMATTVGGIEKVKIETIKENGKYTTYYDFIYNGDVIISHFDWVNYHKETIDILVDYCKNEIGIEFEPIETEITESSNPCIMLKCYKVTNRKIEYDPSIRGYRVVE